MPWSSSGDILLDWRWCRCCPRCYNGTRGCFDDGPVPQAFSGRQVLRAFITRRDTFSGEPPEWKGWDESTWEWSPSEQAGRLQRAFRRDLRTSVYAVSKRLNKMDSIPAFIVGADYRELPMHTLLRRCLGRMMGNSPSEARQSRIGCTWNDSKPSSGSEAARH